MVNELPLDVNSLMFRCLFHPIADIVRERLIDNGHNIILDAGNGYLCIPKDDNDYFDEDGEEYELTVVHNHLKSKFNARYITQEHIETLDKNYLHFNKLILQQILEIDINTRDWDNADNPDSDGEDDT